MRETVRKDRVYVCHVRTNSVSNRHTVIVSAENPAMPVLLWYDSMNTPCPTTRLRNSISLNNRDSHNFAFECRKCFGLLEKRLKVYPYCGKGVNAAPEPHSENEQTETRRCNLPKYFRVAPSGIDRRWTRARVDKLQVLRVHLDHSLFSLWPFRLNSIHT